MSGPPTAESYLLLEAQPAAQPTEATAVAPAGFSVLHEPEAIEA